MTATLDDASSLITYKGFSTLSGTSDTTPIVSTNVTSASLGGTLSYTGTAGATATLVFTGEETLNGSKLRVCFGS